MEIAEALVAGAGGELVSSVVDDTFYVAQQAFTRSVISCSPIAASAIANLASGHLGQDFLDSVLREMVSAKGDAATRLGLNSGSGATGGHSHADGARANSVFAPQSRSSPAPIEVGDIFSEAFERDMTGAAKLSSGLPTAMNSVYMCSGSANRFADMIEEAFEANFPDEVRMGTMAVMMLREETAKACETMLENVAGEMVRGCIAPSLIAALKKVVDKMDYEPSLKKFEAYERTDPYADNFVLHHINGNRTLEQCVNALEKSTVLPLTMRFVASSVAAALEERLLLKAFNEVGALQLERDVTRIVTGLLCVVEDMGSEEVRESAKYIGSIKGDECRDPWDDVRAQFARMFHWVFLLGFSEPSDVVELEYPNPALTEEEVRRVLQLRSDFDSNIVEKLDLSKVALMP